jgi:hypothetical protein
MEQVAPKILKRLQAKGFEVKCLHHAEAIATIDFPSGMDEIESALGAISIPIDEIVAGGGGEAEATQRLRKALTMLRWTKRSFQVEKTINGQVRESISHVVDHVRELGTGTIALEIEWNNKDPFFDRDLENFKRLHAEGAISAGIIVTRGTSLHAQMRPLISDFARVKGIDSFETLAPYDELTSRQRSIIERRLSGAKPPSFADAWVSMFCSDKYGEATTHWNKLMERVRRGVGNPCPLVLIGIPAGVVTQAK